MSYQSVGYIIGSDIGTSSCKTVLMDHRAQVVATASQSYPTKRPNRGWAEQDPEDWYEAFCQTVGDILGQTSVGAGEIQIICIAGVTHNPVLLDEKGSLLRPAIHFWDRRSVREAGEIKQTWGDHVRQNALNEVDALWTWPQLLWIRKHEPDIWASIASLLFPKDYIRQRLAGQLGGQPFSDPIDPTGTLLFDPAASSWIAPFVEDLELPVSSLASIQQPLKIIGELSAGGAADTGLKPGTPLITGTTDTAAEVVGAGALSSGQGIIKLASVGRIMLVSDQIIDDPHSINYPHVFAPLWYPGTVTKYGAGAYKWAQEAFWPELPENGAYQVMDAAATKVPPGSQGLIFRPHLDGEYAPQWDPELKASFTGLTIEHGRPHFTRSVLEGVAYQIRAALEQIVHAGGHYHEIRLIGGGSKSPLWSQIMADVLGCQLLVPVGQSAAFGAALLAGITAGFFPVDPDLLAQYTKVERIHDPDPDVQSLYFENYEIIQELNRSIEAIARH